VAFKRKAQLVWLQSPDEMRLVVFLPIKLRDELEVVPSTIRVSDLVLPIITTMPMPHTQTLYRQFISIEMRDGELTAGPVFAVLTAMRKDGFAGNRADIRDLAATLTRLGGFLYVLPVTSVTPSAPWSGYIRVAPKRWMKVPCPRPEAIYNRIPFRAMERTQEALAAKRLIEREEIPMFNPEYFNKTNGHYLVKSSVPFDVHVEVWIHDNLLNCIAYNVTLLRIVELIPRLINQVHHIIELLPNSRFALWDRGIVQLVHEFLAFLLEFTYTACGSCGIHLAALKRFIPSVDALVHFFDV
jgi:hypothetical protein